MEDGTYVDEHSSGFDSALGEDGSGTTIDASRRMDLIGLLSGSGSPAPATLLPVTRTQSHESTTTSPSSTPRIIDATPVVSTTTSTPLDRVALDSTAAAAVAVSVAEEEGESETALEMLLREASSGEDVVRAVSGAADVDWSFVDTGAGRIVGHGAAVGNGSSEASEEGGAHSDPAAEHAHKMEQLRALAQIFTSSKGSTHEHRPRKKASQNQQAQETMQFSRAATTVKSGAFTVLPRVGVFPTAVPFSLDVDHKRDSETDADMFLQRIAHAVSGAGVPSPDFQRSIGVLQREESRPKPEYESLGAGERDAASSGSDSDTEK